MSFLRQTGRSGFLAARQIRSAPRFFSAYPSIRAHQGYGDSKGDPVSDNPQAQGKNPQVHKEHPGPEAPSAAGGSGGSGTKTSESSSGSSQSSDSSSRAKNGARPAIHDEAQPKKTSPDAEQHNKELAQRKEKTHVKDDGEKVDSSSWSGDSGSLAGKA